MTTDTPIASVRFRQPVQLKGLGMVDHLELGIDPESKKPFNEGVLATFVAGARAIRVTTTSGETWIPLENVSSFQPAFVDRLKASKAK